MTGWGGREGSGKTEIEILHLYEKCRGLRADPSCSLNSAYNF